MDFIEVDMMPHLLNALLAKVRVSAGVQQALLSDHHGSLPVAVDGAALQVDGCLEDRQPVVAQQAAPGLVVLVKVGHHGGATLRHIRPATVSAGNTASQLGVMVRQPCTEIASNIL